MSQSASENAILKVLTINIWNRQGPWDQRLALLRAGIAQLAPDVVGMQEVLTDGTRSLADEIADGLGYATAFGEAKALPGGISFGNAVLSRFPILSQRTYSLPSAETDEVRSVLSVELDTPTGPLPLLTTHLAWKFHHGFVREKQVLRIADIFKQDFPVRETALPPVLVGDFNARPDATEIRFLKGLHALEGRSIYLADCFEEVGDGPGYTFDARRNPFATFTHEAPRRIDYVFVRGPDKRGRGKALSACVVFEEEVAGVTASDHYGVLVELTA